MTGNEPTIVHAVATGEASDPFVRVAETSARTLVERITGMTEPSDALVVIDVAAGDHDELVALASVLVSAGVAHIETSSPQVVRRVFDTHCAISTGTIEVLEP